jgi:hypothetical protein
MVVQFLQLIMRDAAAHSSSDDPVSQAAKDFANITLEEW